MNKAPEELIKELHNTPWTIERQVIQEPDYRQIAATEAGKIPHKTLQEYLSDCDKIYNWLVQNEKKKIRKYPLTIDECFKPKI